MDSKKPLLINSRHSEAELLAREICFCTAYEPRIVVNPYGEQSLPQAPRAPEANLV
jgi:hypothetical protein